MFKSTLFIAIALIIFTSCTEDSLVDPIVGDYTGTLMISPADTTAITETFADVEVTEHSPEQISISLGPQYTNYIGDVSEDFEITTQSYEGISAGGRELIFPTGKGEYRTDTIVGSSEKIKTITISFEDQDGRENAAWLQLVEKI